MKKLFLLILIACAITSCKSKTETYTCPPGYVCIRQAAYDSLEATKKKICWNAYRNGWALGQKAELQNQINKQSGRKIYMDLDDAWLSDSLSFKVQMLLYWN